jgi:hypothetical protein
MVILNNTNKDESINLSRFKEVLNFKKILKNVVTNEMVNVENPIMILGPKTATIFRVN